MLTEFLEDYNSSLLLTSCSESGDRRRPSFAVEGGAREPSGQFFPFEEYNFCLGCEREGHYASSGDVLFICFLMFGRGRNQHQGDTCSTVSVEFWTLVLGK